MTLRRERVALRPEYLRKTNDAEDAENNVFDRGHSAMRHRRVLLLVGRSGKPPPTTSASARPLDVAFLSLPAHATSVRYWDHWHDRIAVFESSEADFRAVFPAIPFAEMTERKTYLVGGFGNPSNPPWQLRMTADASSGLFYENIADHGGGETILYDRATKTGFYEYAAW